MTRFVEPFQGSRTCSPIEFLRMSDRRLPLHLPGWLSTVSSKTPSKHNSCGCEAEFYDEIWVAIPSLINLLTDEDVYVRSAAASAFTKLAEHSE